MDTWLAALLAILGIIVALVIAFYVKKRRQDMMFKESHHIRHQQSWLAPVSDFNSQ